MYLDHYWKCTCYQSPVIHWDEFKRIFPKPLPGKRQACFIHVFKHLNPPEYFIPTNECPFLSYFWYYFFSNCLYSRRRVTTNDKSTRFHSFHIMANFSCGITQKHLPKCHFALVTWVPLDGLSLPPPELGPITRSRRAAERTAHSPHHQVSSSISVTNKEEFWNMANKTKNA
jgi:hypothetical protein